MPNVIVTMKADAPDSEVASVKQNIKDQGGKITHEYTLIKGFAAELPDNQFSTLESHQHVERIEHDQEVRTQ